MNIEIGTRVRIESGTAADGLTGVVDEIDGGPVPYHVKFDTPRDGVEGTWFDKDELVVLGKGQ